MLKFRTIALGRKWQQETQREQIEYLREVLSLHYSKPNQDNSQQLTLKI
jgi:hypothetical protein